MENKIFFISGEKSFELIDYGEGWFVLIERGRRFSSRIKIDEENLRWVCDVLNQASKRTGNNYRRWGRKSQVYIYRAFQNFNMYGRYMRIETLQGIRKSAVIVPEPNYNRGWGDIAGNFFTFSREAYNK